MRLLAGAAVVVMAIGCMDTTRVNTACAWSDRSAGPLDLRRAADREHLRVDVQVAGELAVRFADVSNRNVAVNNRPIRERCRAAMYDSIMQRHSVTAADLARAELARVWWADVLLVLLPVAALTVAAMDRVTARVHKALGADNGTAATAGAFAMAPVVAGLSVAVAQWWAFLVESALLRNSHVSFRAFQIPVMLHGWIAFAVALALCLATMIVRLRRESMRPRDVRRLRHAYEGLFTRPS